jgi:hypothetical protein
MHSASSVRGSLDFGAGILIPEDVEAFLSRSVVQPELSYPGAVAYLRIDTLAIRCI